MAIESDLRAVLTFQKYSLSINLLVDVLQLIELNGGNDITEKDRSTRVDDIP